MDRRTFVTRSTAAAIVTRGEAQSVLSALAGPEILQIDGREIVHAGRPVRLRGVNLGGWMLIEDYMIGLPWTEWKIREQFGNVLGPEAYKIFFDAFDRAYAAEADIAFIAQQGFNLVRIPFNYRHFEDDLSPGKWKEEGFTRLDRVVQLCQKHKLWVILDLHAAPGAQARDQNAGSAYGEAYFWYHRQFLSRTTDLWVELARRYRGNATVAAYNLLEEPVTGNVGLLNDFYRTTIRAIRTIDPKHIILLEPNLWAADVASLHDDLFADPQVTITIHPYYQGSAALKSLTEYPALAGTKSASLRAALNQFLDAKYAVHRIARPVIAAEFGVFRNDPQPFPVQLAISHDLLSCFEERGWHWATWCYKDLRDSGFVTTRPGSAWRRFLDAPRIASFKQRYQELAAPFTREVAKMLAGTDILADTRDQWAREVARDFDPPTLDFILRRLATHSLPELAEMAESFAFASCEVHEDQLAVLRAFLPG